MTIAEVAATHDILLKKLVQVFLQENAKVNLSAHRTEERCWVGNVLDSLALLETPIVASTRLSILDIGTGGGFPLLPLAICLGDKATLTGMDSTQKKVDAVARIVTALQLGNVSDLLCGRAEEFGRQMQEEFDVVTARAVADTAVLLEICSPFAKVGGWVVLWKSLNIEDELSAAAKAMKTLHCVLEGVHRYRLPDPFGKRQLLMFRKRAATPVGFPRSVGVPAKNPLT